MPIYYLVGVSGSLFHGGISVGITSYFLLKEGFIRVEDYREDPNDAYYISDRHYNRSDFCYEVTQEWKDSSFLNLEDAKRHARVLLERQSADLVITLFKNIQECLEKIDSSKCYKGEDDGK
jgi:hypothetical protein